MKREDRELALTKAVDAIKHQAWLQNFYASGWPSGEAAIAQLSAQWLLKAAAYLESEKA